MPWSRADLPDLTGRTLVVTGATSGLGEATTIALASRGAHVVLAARSPDRAERLMDRIRAHAPDASLEHVTLDLADLRSVAAAAGTLTDRHDRVDAVIANAGIMAPPLSRTTDGFELQFGVNHLGHFALVGAILPAILAAEAGRVVMVSSGAHRIGTMDLDDLDWRSSTYRRWEAYGRSKLANLLYVAELQRRFDEAGSMAIAVGAHPGYARTALQTTGPTMQGGVSGLVTGWASSLTNVVAGQPASQGALPQLYAATATDVPGGSYWGPDRWLEMRGHPARADRSAAAQDPRLARALWDRSEQLTGVEHDLRPSAA